MENEALKEVILQLAALSGEVSECAVMHLPSSEKYLTNLLLEMRKDNLIKRSDRDDTIGYRLSQSGKRYLSEVYPERYRDYFGNGGITDKVRLDGIHRQRYQRMSEVNTMMYNVGARLFPGTKPTLDAPLAGGSQSSQSRYYTSFEMKALGDEAIKINPSRAMGLLRSKNGSYLMYHTHTGPIKWEDMTEYRTRMLLGNKLGVKVRSIMIGEDMDCAFALLQSDGGKQNRYYKVSAEHQTDMLFIPHNRYGEFMLKYAVITDTHLQMRNKILTTFKQKQGSGSPVCDGYADEKTGVLFACDFDMVRLVLFKTGVEVRKMQGIVYCFDFQADALRKYLGDRISIRMIDSKQTADLFGLPHGGDVR